MRTKASLSVFWAQTQVLSSAAFAMGIKLEGEVIGYVMRCIGVNFVGSLRRRDLQGILNNGVFGNDRVAEDLREKVCKGLICGLNGLRY